MLQHVGSRLWRDSIGNPKPQATLPACKGISKDLAGINSASLNVLYPFCKGAYLEKGQDLQTAEAFPENAVGRFTL